MIRRRRANQHIAPPLLQFGSRARSTSRAANHKWRGHEHGLSLEPRASETRHRLCRAQPTRPVEPSYLSTCTRLDRRRRPGTGSNCSRGYMAKAPPTSAAAAVAVMSVCVVWLAVAAPPVSGGAMGTPTWGRCRCWWRLVAAAGWRIRSRPRWTRRRTGGWCWRCREASSHRPARRSTPPGIGAIAVARANLVNHTCRTPAAVKRFISARRALNSLSN